MHIEKLIRVSLALFLSLGICGDALAIGAANIGNEVLSARAAGQGYVGVAGQNDDPSVVYANPAAMTNLRGTQISAGSHWENIYGTYKTDAGAETKAKTSNVAVPNFSMTQSLLDGQLSLGLSVQSPFGLETNWPGNSPLRYVATNSRLGMVLISPAVAYQIHPNLSVGAGLDYANVFRAQLDRHVNVDALNFALSSPTSGAPDAISSLRGEGKAWGTHVGLLLEPHEKHSIGVTYHSKMKVRINGSLSLSGLSGSAALGVFGGSNYATSAYTDIVLPSNVQAGYAFKPSERWLLEVDAAWYHWSGGDDLRVRYPAATSTQQSVLNTGNPSKTDLRDAWSFAAGANYKASDRWQFRGGTWYEPWAMPEHRFNPAFNDLSRYGLTAGFGVNLTKNVGLDMAYSAVFMHNRHIHNNVGFATTGNSAVDIDGTYKNFANLFALNLTYRFGS